ncbi:NAD(P)-binding protein [Mucilaginibacter gossypii]|uniref:protoporphyrinogen/coproporphyrinogen oxidase n=1 Tax=Mucilaginibacter gossypii TaxID=551996 RepID=UPI000DCB6E3A|nr:MULTISPECIES: NAD(P)-binding protein [Mucilaginibacter]QTE40253.1 NAD(P)-binding protein [Mucilaginibacter gossypii]RAV57536.1 hypothetical protein DIU36_11035 [Mucilaginibacter rubeus]
MVVILGAGIAGLSAGYHLNLKGVANTIYEKRERWGGLCDNFTVGNGFRFDHFVHLSFSTNEYVNDLFARSAEFQKHFPVSTNYYKGSWLKHPAQNNLAPLSTDEKVKIILDFVNKPDITEPQNYYEWLLTQFGSYFTDHFPGVYTEKYWGKNASELTVDWVAKRFSTPPLDNLLKGAFEVQNDNFYYASEMRYPLEGGYKSFLRLMAEQANIQCGREASLIDLKTKRVEFSNGSNEYFDTLVSSLPLPDLINIIKDVPTKVREAAAKLVTTSGQLVSLGFSNPDVAKYLWFYIYDSDILPSRAYSPSLKSSDNVPEGKSSLQFETYYSNSIPAKLKGGALIEHIVNKGKKMGLFSAEDVEVSDYREVKHANVIFDHNRTLNLSLVQNYLDEKGIGYIGRFGEWKYLWSDQSLLSGKQFADSFKSI